MDNKNKAQSGFSLLETLLALFLFALAVTALLRGQQAVTVGVIMQSQQRQAWRLAAQRLEGMSETPAGWRITLTSNPTLAGCYLLIAEAISPMGRRARLQRLDCRVP